VCITKETTLKGIRVSDIKINNCIFADQRSDTFCTAHVCSLIVMCVVCHISEWIMRSMLRSSLDHPDDLMLCNLFVC